jgi:hypothetical protein
MRAFRVYSLLPSCSNVHARSISSPIRDVHYDVTFFMLDIMIRDAGDNKRSLDDVRRSTSRRAGTPKDLRRQIDGVRSTRRRLEIVHRRRRKSFGFATGF